jgi:phosphatidylserine/phosphatidylglycerophosphate/cardiolipin synthase-like enzyme
MGYYCNECNRSITQAELEYSKKYYGRPLYRTCQKSANVSHSIKAAHGVSPRSEETEEELNIQDVLSGAHKVLKGVSKRVKERSITGERGFNRWIDDWRKSRKGLELSYVNRHFFLKGNDLEDFTNGIINAAEKTILLTNPYVEHCSLTDNLVKRAGDGIEIKIVLRPESGSNKRTDCQKELKGAGINVLINSRIHSKIIIVDDKVAVVSSMNFYPGSSAGASHEVGIVSIDESVVDSATKYIQDFK